LARVRQTEANLRLARVNLQRAEQLVRQGHVARQVLDERAAELGVRDADLAAARAEVARLQQLLDFRRVAAPFAGVVVARNVEKGDLVEADSPEPDRYLFRVARLDKLRVFADIPQSEVGNVGVGTPVHVRFSEFPEATLRGDVKRTAGALNTASRSMRVEVHLANPDGLPSGMIGRVTFSTPAPRGLVTVPINALVTRAEGTFVALVTASSTVQFVRVGLARNLGSRVEVESGLTPDDRVIVNPNGLLEDGDVVTVQG
jgi:RND family efflux transporter MFP subunit